MEKPDSAAALSASVIVCSDRASEGTYEDRSGPAAVEWLSTHGFSVISRQLISDDPDQLKAALMKAASARLVVVSGGTGLGPRDHSPQVLESYADYSVPGIGEILRAQSLKYSLNAYLSRCGGYVKDQRLLLALPGNPKAVVEQLAILEDLLPHALSALSGRCEHRRRIEP